MDREELDVHGVFLPYMIAYYLYLGRLASRVSSCMLRASKLIDHQKRKILPHDRHCFRCPMSIWLNLKKPFPLLIGAPHSAQGSPQFWGKRCKLCVKVGYGRSD